MAWSRRRWGKPHQLTYRRGLLEWLERIAANPHVYRKRAELGPGVRLVHHQGLYIVFLVNDASRQVEVIGFPNIHRELTGEVAASLKAWQSDEEQ
jgi:plasmid stabilization system protein ParE